MVRLSAEGAGELLDARRWAVFRRVLGQVLYLSHDRPDIQYAVKEFCRMMSRPTPRSWELLKGSVVT